jgi:hypothetical protein
MWRRARPEVSGTSPRRFRSAGSTVSRDGDASGDDRDVFFKRKPTKSSPSDGVADQAAALQRTLEAEAARERQVRADAGSRIEDPDHGDGARGCADAEADMPLAEAAGARCVQNFDGSHTAIHTTYRISLRSSSIREPRYPLLRVVFGLCCVAAGGAPGTSVRRRGGAPARATRRFS